MKLEIICIASYWILLSFRWKNNFLSLSSFSFVNSGYGVGLADKQASNALTSSTQNLVKPSLNHLEPDRWCSPGKGSFKLNVNASVILYETKFDLGAVIHDMESQVLFVTSSPNCDDVRF